jgi:predicted permease
MPIGLYCQYAERARALDGVAAYRTEERTVTGDGEPQRVNALLTTPSLAAVLGVAPAAGRWLTEADARPGAAAVAVLSHGFWTRRYGARLEVIGRPLTLNGVLTTVVGVMPPSFFFPTQGAATDIWVADQLAPAQGLGLITHSAVGRLRTGASLAQARDELTGLIADLPRVYPGNGLANALATRAQLRSEAIVLKEWTVGGYERSLWLLFAAVALVLLVACANVGNLFLVRFETRQAEISLRSALGAGRVERLRSFLNEAALLAIAGSAVGLALAAGAVRLVVTYGPAALPRLTEVHIDTATILFALGLGVPIALAFAAVLLLGGRAAGPRAERLREAGRSAAAAPGRYRARQLLMGGQVAVALVVLIASALMTRSVQRLRDVDPGFDVNATLTFRIGLPASEYPTRAAAVAAHVAILERLSSIPGVAQASGASWLPLSAGGYGNTVTVEGRVERPDSLPPVSDFLAIAGGYAEAIGMPVLQGRGISAGDVTRGERVTVVNQAVADAYFPGENPLGRRISSGSNPQWLTVVGVVANTASVALNEARPRLKVYMPLSVAGGPDIPAALLTGPSVSNLSYVVRASAGAAAVLPRVREAVDGVDRNLAVSQVATLEDLVDRSMGQMAFVTVLLGVAALVALALGVVGVYGVTSYVIAQRTREIGVRLALGAVPAGVARLMARQSGLVAAAGAAAGLTAALAGGRVLDSQLYGIRPNDAGVLAGTTVLVLAVALCACWLPARRAAKLDPLHALRAE